MATAARLARAGLAGQYMVYETEGGVWHFAAGSAVSVSAHANGITARAAGRTWTADTDGHPLTALAAALSALRDTGGTGRHFYGWAAFELAHFLHADAEATGDDTLLHVLVPSVEVTLTGDRTLVRVVDEAWVRKVADLLAEPPARRGAPEELSPDRTEEVIATGAAAYGRTVAREDGRVSTQPLAGTRARGADPVENERRRAELLADPKEIHEHAVSVRLAWEEMEAVCRLGSLAVEEFMAVRARGSVQHLASRVTGALRPGAGPWDAFASRFPAITATGVSKRDALRALARHEPGPRGLYGGAVFRGSTGGALDAALVLRTLIGAGDEAWLRAGAGVTAQSSPEREIEETCEKLRSVAPYLRFAEDRPDTR